MVFKTQDLEALELTKEQANLLGKGYAGPPVALDGIQLSEEQVIDYTPFTDFEFVPGTYRD